MHSWKLGLVLAVAAACCQLCSAGHSESVEKYMHCQNCGPYTMIWDGWVNSLHNLLVGVGLRAPEALAYTLHLGFFLIAVLNHLCKNEIRLLWVGISNMVKEVIADEYYRGYLKEVGLKLVTIIECILSKLHTALNW